VSSASSNSIWSRFEHDPRDPAYAGMRASDRDRAVVHDVLSEAYAEGRLDREELDDRTTTVDGAKTYADLVPPIRDLAFDAGPQKSSPARRSDLERSARLYYGDKLRDAIFGFLVPNLIVWLIWFLSGHNYFAWPIFVSIPTGLNLLRVASSRGQIIESRIQKLERREEKAIEESRAAQSKPADDGSTSESNDEHSDSGSILSEDKGKPEEA
jgi:hypothetical protein